MKAAQYAKYFIRIILAICAIAIIFTIVHAITPKIDVFSCVGVHLTAEHPRELTYTFNADFFAEQVLELKPNADIRDVEDLAKSIQVKLDIIDIIDSPESVLKATGVPYQFDYRLSLVQYDKRLLRKIGIKFYETSRELHF